MRLVKTADGAPRGTATTGGAQATAMIFGVGFFAVHDMVGKLVVENYPVAQMLACVPASRC
jgi:hypothetical protein